MLGLDGIAVHQEAAGDDHGLAREESRMHHGLIDSLIHSVRSSEGCHAPSMKLQWPSAIGLSGLDCQASMRRLATRRPCLTITTLA